MAYHNAGLRVEAVSETNASEGETDIYETRLPSATRSLPYDQISHHTPTHQQSLPAFPSWDPDWQSGGVSSDKAFTRHPVQSRAGSWEPSLPAQEYKDPFVDPYQARPISTYSEKKRSTSNGYGKGGNVTEKEKRKRLRMLEQEFGDEEVEEKVVKKRKSSATFSNTWELPGGKKRAALRWLEGMLILVAIGAGPLVAFVSHTSALDAKLIIRQMTKPEEKAPPAGKLPTIGIWVLSGISLLSFIWLFIISPCCTSDRKQEHNGMQSFNMSGYSPLESTGCCGGRKKPKQQQGMNVNLVIDPSMFQQLQDSTRSRDSHSKDSAKYKSRKSRQSRRESSEWDSSSSEDSDDSAASSFRIPKQPQDDDMLEQAILSQQTSSKYSFANRQARENARRRLKKHVVYDSFMAILWLAVSIWAIGFGERCPPGESAGW